MRTQTIALNSNSMCVIFVIHFIHSHTHKQRTPSGEWGAKNTASILLVAADSLHQRVSCKCARAFGAYHRKNNTHSQTQMTTNDTHAVVVCEATRWSLP